MTITILHHGYFAAIGSNLQQLFEATSNDPHYQEIYCFPHQPLFKKLIMTSIPCIRSFSMLLQDFNKDYIWREALWIYLLKMIFANYLCLVGHILLLPILRDRIPQRELLNFVICPYATMRFEDGHCISRESLALHLFKIAPCCLTLCLMDIELQEMACALTYKEKNYTTLVIIM